MRIWHPVPPFCLDDKRLLAEHLELHVIWNIVTNLECVESGYKNHPETKRWLNHPWELFLRHIYQVSEMERRGWNHKSPLKAYDDVFKNCNLDVEWPKTLQSVQVMREKLAEKIKVSIEKRSK